MNVFAAPAPLRCALLLSVAVAAKAAAPPVRISDAAVVFVAHGSLGMRIEGRTRDLEAVTTAPDAIRFDVHLATLETGIALRDKHMHDEYLEVQKYPVAELRIARSDLPAPGISGNVPAELTLHGRKHSVQVACRSTPAAGYEVTALMRVDMRDYGIASPKYMGISVKPEVDVSVTFHLDRQ